MIRYTVPILIFLTHRQTAWTIVWEDYIAEDSEIQDEYTNTVEDKKIIAELFSLLKLGDKRIILMVFEMNPDQLLWI